MIYFNQYHTTFAFKVFNFCFGV